MTKRPHVVQRACGILRVAVVTSMFGILLGCSAANTTSATPTIMQSYPTPLPTARAGVQPSPVTGLLDPAPANCAMVAPPQTFTSTNFGGGFIGATTFAGRSPAWELGLALGSGPLQLNANAGGATPYPAMKVMWVVGPNYPHPVTLTGHEVRTGAPLWFQVYSSDAVTAYTTRAVLDPALPNRGSTENRSGAWNIWGIGVVVLAAGCYQLDVTAAATGWRMVFASGR
jgi:hypothetical protein